MKKQWMVPLAVLALLVGGAVTALLAVDAGATTANDSSPITSADDIDPDECNFVHNINACSAEELEKAGIEPVSDGTDGQVPITSADDIDPGECSLVHNINACSAEELEKAGVEPGGDGTDGQPPITSADGIGPDECNLVHNIDACSPEEIAQGYADNPIPSD